MIKAAATVLTLAMVSADYLDCEALGTVTDWSNKYAYKLRCAAADDSNGNPCLWARNKEKEHSYN